MSIMDLLNTTATVRRYSEGTRNALGEPARTWADASTGNPARLEGISGKETMQPRVVEATHRVFMSSDASVGEADRLVIDGRTFEVVFVDLFPGGMSTSHIEIECKELRT